MVDGLERSAISLKLAVLTVDDSSIRKESYDADVKSYILSHSEFASILNPERTDLASNVILITLSTHVRMLGVYVGADVPRRDAVKKESLDSMRPLAQRSYWSSALHDGANSAIRAANNRANLDPAVVLWWTVGGVLIAMIPVVLYAVRRGQRRSKIQKTELALKDVKRKKGRLTSPQAMYQDALDESRRTSELLQGIDRDLLVGRGSAIKLSTRLDSHVARINERVMRGAMPHRDGTTKLSRLVAVSLTDARTLIDRAKRRRRLDQRKMTEFRRGWAHNHSNDERLLGAVLLVSVTGSGAGVGLNSGSGWTGNEINQGYFTSTNSGSDSGGGFSGGSEGF